MAIVLSAVGLNPLQARADEHETPSHEGASAHESAAAEHGEHGGGHHGPAPLNWADIGDKERPAVIALFINFGILVTAYYLLGKKPVANALKERRVAVGKEIDEAQKLLDEANERAKKYQAALKVADADAATAKATLIAAGTGETSHLLSEAQEKAERMKRDVERLIEQERKAVQRELLERTVELASDEAARLLEKSVTAEDHARLAQDLLSELARKPAARTSGTSAGGVHS